MPVTINDVTTNLYLPEQIRKAGDEAEYIDYAEQQQHRVRKNLWSKPIEQGVVSGGGDEGTSTKRIRSTHIPVEPNTTYTFSSNLIFRTIYGYWNNEKVGIITQSQIGTIITKEIPVNVNNVSIALKKEDDVDITPADFEWGQIEVGSEATTYEPYIENTEVDVTLPALPTIAGTNTLSVGTGVQPVYIELTGKIKETS